MATPRSTSSAGHLQVAVRPRTPPALPPTPVHPRAHALNLLANRRIVIGTLHMRILRCHGLDAIDYDPTKTGSHNFVADPYVMAMINNTQAKMTPCLHDTTQPVWINPDGPGGKYPVLPPSKRNPKSEKTLAEYATFTFNIRAPNTEMVNIIVMDQDDYPNADDEMASVDFDVKHIMNDPDTCSPEFPGWGMLPLSTIRHSERTSPRQPAPARASKDHPPPPLATHRPNTTPHRKRIPSRSSLCLRHARFACGDADGAKERKHSMTNGKGDVVVQCYLELHKKSKTSQIPRNAVAPALAPAASAVVPGGMAGEMETTEVEDIR